MEGKSESLQYVTPVVQASFLAVSQSTTKERLGKKKKKIL